MIKQSILGKNAVPPGKRTHESNPLRYKVNKFLKRASDIFFSLFFLVLLSPLLILIALLIKITSPGEIIYIQERVTNENRIFKIYKFRTMVTGAEDQTGPALAIDNDLRCTAVGLILRRLSFDEFPQLFNVLKGDMSLVGPRPERPFYINILKDEIKDYTRRHDVKSGMTGWAQIHGLRGQTSIEKRVRYDLYYIHNWNIILDFIIIYRTFFVIFRDFVSGKAC
jgi:putative colanic acid biosynthesis UDP-glucose lipid carrier transferase